MTITDKEIGYIPDKNWKIITTGKSVIATLDIGNKQMVAYFSEHDKGVSTAVQIVDNQNHMYFVRIEDGKLSEKYLDKDAVEIFTPNKLKEYLPVLYTLPETLRQLIDPLILK